MKSELDEYLGEQIVISSSKSFDVLAWWKGNCSKYPILSKMTRDVLSIPISTVASESAFSAGGRVIEPHRSCLKPETVKYCCAGLIGRVNFMDLRNLSRKTALRRLRL